MEPGHAKPIDLTIGEPREAMPPFVVEKLTEAASRTTRSYPPIRGTQELRAAIQRGRGAATALPPRSTPTREVLPHKWLARGAFLAALPAAGRKQVTGRPAILMCNPYYSAYIGGALAVNAEPVYPQRHAGDRASARPRSARFRQGTARAHRRALPVLARQPAGRGCQPGLHRPCAAARTRPRLHAVLR